MELTPAFKNKLQIKIREAVEEVLKEIAIEITKEAGHYITKRLYSRHRSLYYDRDKDDGGFLSTFATASDASRILDSELKRGRKFT